MCKIEFEIKKIMLKVKKQKTKKHYYNSKQILSHVTMPKTLIF